MFGRKKRNDDVETDEVIDEDLETTEEALDDLDAKEAPKRMSPVRRKTPPPTELTSIAKTGPSILTRLISTLTT